MTECIADLLLISVTVSPRDVENVLDSLAGLPFPINADLKYEEWKTTVEFPAYRSSLEEVKAMLAAKGFDDAQVHFRPAFSAVA
jgi:hypothetical protein